jgi:hypothetical protein
MEGLNYFRMERRGHFCMTVLKQTLMRYPWVPAPSLVLTGEDKFGEVRGQSGDLNSGRVDGQRREDKWLASLQRLDDRIPCNLVERTEHWFEIGQAKDRLTASGGSRHVRTPLAVGTKRSRAGLGCILNITKERAERAEPQAGKSNILAGLPARRFCSDTAQRARDPLEVALVNRHGR